MNQNIPRINFFPVETTLMTDKYKTARKFVNVDLFRSAFFNKLSTVLINTSKAHYV